MAKRINNNNTNKVKVTEIDKIMREASDSFVVRKWNELDITVKRTLSLREYVEFINKVVDSCFDDNGKYIPEIKTFAIRNSILEYYTNIQVSNNASHMYNLIYNTNIIEFIINEIINDTQFEEIIAAINEKIDYKIRVEADTIHAKLLELTNMYESLTEQFSGMINSLTPDDISNLVKALSNDRLDEQKLVDAIYKKNTD